MSSCSASTLCVPHKTKTYVKSQMKHDLNGSRLCGSSSNVETAFYAVRAEINSMCDHGEDVHTLAGQQTQTQRVLHHTKMCVSSVIVSDSTDSATG